MLVELSNAIVKQSWLVWGDKHLYKPVAKSVGKGKL